MTPLLAKSLLRKALSIPAFAWIARGGARTQIAASLIARASAERDRKNYHTAAILYEEALELAPKRAGVRVQCAHMFKEAGDLVRAEDHYLRALKRMPDDADLALQLGHFYKIAGRLDASEASYRRALELNPGWAEPARELEGLVVADDVSPHKDAGDARELDWDRLAPELLPAARTELRRTHLDSVHIRRLGSRLERSRWGVLRTLRGVEAIRGFCVSAEPIDEVQVALNDQPIVREAPRASVPEPGDEGRRKFVFNIWFDVSAIAPGPFRIELSFMAGGQRVLTHRERVLIAPPLTEQDHPASDGVVDPPGGTGQSLEARIDARPSVVRPARRSVLPSPPSNILVVRADQLGDIVVSVPGLRRLRELFPEARIVGLLTPANADFARSAGLFDEIVVVDFPEDPQERRRVMPAEAQEALRRRLEPYGFDIAIDLAEVSGSRPLLRLSGARFLYGFHDHDWPWLTGGFEGQTHDPRNGSEIAAQSTKILALVERLGASLNSRARIERRTDLHREMLVDLGLGGGDRYALLHAGARLEFSRWPGFSQLAERLLEATEFKVLLLTDGTLDAASLPAALRGSARFSLIDGRLSFDAFDALVSFAEVLVGNDSGPKHLAALRGTPVVSVHSARLNWSEWGQELTGSIISRRVPCASCGISHDQDECGKDFACIRRITVDEVFGAVMDQLRREPRP